MSKVFFCVTSMAAKILMDLGQDIKLPAIGLGTWQANDIELENALNIALKLGYRYIDTAYNYQNEVVIGKVLKEWFDAEKLERRDVFITTKLPLQGIHPDRVELFLEKSLGHLQLDYVDLFLIPFPVCMKYVEGQESFVRTAPAIEPVDHIAVWQKMEEQVDAGRTRTIGLANFNVRQISRIVQTARIKPSCVQMELHVYLQQNDVVEFCKQNNIFLIAFAPLGSPGYNDFLDKIGLELKVLPDLLQDYIVTKIAQKYQKTSAQVLLRFLLQKNIAAIPKSTNPKRLKENISVFDFEIDEDDMRALTNLEIGEGARVFDFKLDVLYDSPEYPFPK